jgi:hypothetical protein
MKGFVFEYEMEGKEGFRSVKAKDIEDAEWAVSKQLWQEFGRNKIIKLRLESQFEIKNINDETEF